MEIVASLTALSLAFALCPSAVSLVVADGIATVPAPSTACRRVRSVSSRELAADENQQRARDVHTWGYRSIARSRTRHHRCQE
jgi:hypothetical protein